MSPRPAISVGIAAALVIAVPFIGSSEGKRNDPYIDMAGIPTVCYGETNVKMRHYTDVECIAMLKKSVEGYATQVVAISPTLNDRTYELAATTSLAYNVGLGRYKQSTMAKLFAQKKWAAGCAELKKWVYVKGNKVKGLVNRRDKEYAICIKGSQRT